MTLDGEKEQAGRRAGGELLVPAMILAVPLLVEMKVLSGQVLPIGFSPGGSDLLIHTLPIRKLFWESIRHGVLPLWTHRMYGGYPLFASLQAGMMAPLSYPPALLSLVPALGLFLWMHRIVAAVSTYVLARTLGQSRSGAVTAGLVFSYCGFMVGHLMHLDVFAGACFTPLVLLGMLRAARGQGGLLLGLALTYQFLSGSPQQTALTIVLGTPLMLWIAAGPSGNAARTDPPPAQEGGRGGPGAADGEGSRGTGGEARGVPPARALSRLALPLLLWPLLALPQLLPTMELVSRSDRGHALSEAEILRYPFPPRALACLFWPAATGSIVDGSFPFDSWSGLWAETGVYAGVLAPWALLLVLWLPGARAERRAAAVGLLALAIAMGPATPVGRIYAHLPVLSVFRNITRPLIFLDLALALALGQVISRVACSRSAALAAGLAAVCIADVATHAYRERGDLQVAGLLGGIMSGEERPNDSRNLPEWASSEPCWGRSYTHGAGAFFGDAYRRLSMAGGETTTHVPLEAAIDHASGPGEIGMLWNLPTLGGFAGLAEARARAVAEGEILFPVDPAKQISPLAIHLLQSCGVEKIRVLGTEQGRRGSREPLLALVTDEGGLQPFSAERKVGTSATVDDDGPADVRRGYVPFALTTTRARWVRSPQEALAIMANPDFEPTWEPVLEAERAAAPAEGSQGATAASTDCAPTSVTPTLAGASVFVVSIHPVTDPAEQSPVHPAESPARISQSPVPLTGPPPRTTAQCTTYVVLANMYDPGWQAWSSRGPVRIVRANFCTMAAVLDQPAPWVMFHYLPPGFTIGLTISGPLLVGLLLWQVVAGVRRRRDRHEG